VEYGTGSIAVSACWCAGLQKWCAIGERVRIKGVPTSTAQHSMCARDGDRVISLDESSSADTIDRRE